MQQQTKNKKKTQKTKKQKPKIKIKKYIVVFDYFIHSLYTGNFKDKSTYSGTALANRNCDDENYNL